MRLSLPAAVAALSAILSVAALAAAQDRPPPGPPPEAFTACESKAAGDACVVHVFDKDIDGTCREERNGSKLFCLPDHMPGPPPPKP